MKQHLELGQWAESQAKQIVLAAGYLWIRSNYHSRYGEIDLIVEKDNFLVFIEVRARGKTHIAHAVDTVSRHKQKKIMLTAMQFLQEYPQYESYFCRFDVICFDFRQRIAKTIQQDFSQFAYDQEWIENAFTFD